MNRRHIGRDPATLAADLAAIRDEIGETTTAQALWHRLDCLSRSKQASAYTRRRAEKAAVALGSLLDDLADPDEAETPFTWNDR